MVFAPQRYLFSSILPIPLFPYNQRKHVEKHRFPLVIGTFLCYIQRKYIKKHQFPLIIEIVLLINLPSWNQPKSQRIGIILLFKTIHHTKYAICRNRNLLRFSLSNQESRCTFAKKSQHIGIMTQQEIGKTIRDRRKKLKVDQRTLADLAGVAINTVVAIERGEGNPQLKTLLVVLDTLGLQLDINTKRLAYETM